MAHSLSGVLTSNPPQQSKRWPGWVAVGAFVAGAIATTGAHTEQGQKFAQAAIEVCTRLPVCEMLAVDNEPPRAEPSVSAWPSQEAMRELIPVKYAQRDEPVELDVQCRVRADGGVDQCGAVSGPPDNLLLAGAIQLLTAHTKVNPATVGGRPVASFYKFRLYAGGRDGPQLTASEPKSASSMVRSGSRVADGAGSLTARPSLEVAPPTAGAAVPSTSSLKTAAVPLSSQAHVMNENVEVGTRPLRLLDIGAVFNSDHWGCQPWRTDLRPSYEKPPYRYVVGCWDEKADRRFYRDIQGRYFWSDGTPRAPPQRPRVEIIPSMPRR